MTQYLDWKVGDKVVCVDAHGIDGDCRNKPREGHVYTIRTISTNGAGDIGVRLAEVVNPEFEALAPDNYGSRERGFLAHRFRKVQTRNTDISIFTAMLHDQRQKVPAA